MLYYIMYLIHWALNKVQIIMNVSSMYKSLSKKKKKKTLLWGNGVRPLAPIVTLAEIIFLITREGNILRKTILRKVLTKNGK